MAFVSSTAPDLLAVGWLANRERERRHGSRGYFNYNIRLEATNVCVASCLFCSFARLRPGYRWLVHERRAKVGQAAAGRQHQPLTEVHVVNGLHPDLPFDYYTELLRGFKRIRPAIHLKCFTAVEIAFFSDLYGMTDEQMLRELALHRCIPIRVRIDGQETEAASVIVCKGRLYGGRLPAGSSRVCSAEPGFSIVLFDQRQSRARRCVWRPPCCSAC